MDMLLLSVGMMLLGGTSVYTHDIEDRELITDFSLAMEFLQKQNLESQDVYSHTVRSIWNYNTNITDENNDIMMDAFMTEADYMSAVAWNASGYDLDSMGVENETIWRWFESLTDLGTAAMPDFTKYERMNALVADMETTYSIGRVCLTKHGCIELEPGLTRLLATSRDYDELTTAWKGWRDATGKKMKDKYEEFVELSNEAIRANGFGDTGEYWRIFYESESFAEDTEALFLQLEPLYKQLHAYTRRKLVQLYGKGKFPKEGHIPAHLLASRMYRLAEEFYVSLGLEPMPREFWEHSMIERPTDGREVMCHATAWDFYNGKDFRIQQCTDITMADLITIHHEMGHIQYYLQYKDQPVVFRAGANPGFHEAVGDVLALSVATPKHLQQIGLLSNVQEDTESDINFLMSTALDKIAFLPFSYLMDQWRWSVFSGQTRPDMYTNKWWQLRCRFQGISPPVTRSEDDFDPAAKYHIAANVPYIRYFVSYVIQFQFHKALCDAAGHTGPLHKCDIYRSKEAGALLSRALSLGSSRPWPEVMQIITGQENMDAGPFMEYFKPLTDWLTDQNRDHVTGWEHECPDGLIKAHGSAASQSSNFTSLFLFFQLLFISSNLISVIAIV